MRQPRPERTLGPGHDEFWSFCQNRELRLQRCESCGHIPWPVVRSCENCGSETFAWQRLSGRGRIVSWCSFERDYYGGVLPLPWDTILVELEEGPLFISNPLGFAVGDVTPQMKVSVAFLDCEDKAGPFRAPVFRKLD